MRFSLFIRAVRACSTLGVSARPDLSCAPSGNTRKLCLNLTTPTSWNGLSTMTLDSKSAKDLNEIRQRLYQAEAEGNHLHIKIWKAVLAKLLAQKDTPQPSLKSQKNQKKNRG